ncbi:HAD family hydrolase [bacterium SCSIO 12696]|nr:HAD family hydrolase [bacterium SCSIO 12696]
MTSLVQPDVSSVLEKACQDYPLIAAFDLDETLINGDCAQLWLQFLMEQGWDGAARAYDQCCVLMESYNNGHMNMERYMSVWLQPLHGKTLNELQSLLTLFVDQWIAPRIFTEARAQLQHHIAQGHLPVIISASPDFLVNAIGRSLAVSDCIGIVVSLDKGVISGQCQYPISYREGKIECLQQWLKAMNYPSLGKAVGYFYSDSHNDLPLMKLVPNPCAVNPNPQLAETAQQLGWPINYWGQSASVI